MINKKESFILVTGAAGFIGSALVKKLLTHGYKVLGIDNLNDYYDLSLKKARLKDITSENKDFAGEWHFFELGIDNENLIKYIEEFKPLIVYNLAAQAGVSTL